MDFLRQYLLSVITAALIAGLVARFFHKKTAPGTLIKLICGMFVTITVLSPLIKLRIEDFTAEIDQFSSDADIHVSAGENLAEDARRAIIKTQIETYILDKASSLGASVSVTVSLSESDPPLPASVRISGNLSPHEKIELKRYLKNELGITEDMQIWT